MPPEHEHAERMRAVLHALYVIFDEGYTATSGPDLQRVGLMREATRLVREVRRRLPDDGDVAGLLALMLLTDARRPARTRANGTLVPLAEQDRGRWDRAQIAEDVALISATLPRSVLGRYQLQAAIAAVHAEAPSAEATDCAQIVILYELLERAAPNPMIALNHAVAVAMARGPQAWLDLLAPLESDDRMARHHRLAAVRPHLPEMLGDDAGPRDSYRAAARRTTSLPERRYFEEAPRGSADMDVGLSSAPAPDARGWGGHRCRSGGRRAGLVRDARSG